MLKSQKGFTPIVIIFVVMVLAATFSSFIIKTITTPDQTIEPSAKPSPQASPSNIDVSQSSSSATASPLKFRVNVVIDKEEEEEFEREKESGD